MPSLFSAAQLRRYAGFRRLAGVSVATFDQMLERLRGPWEAAQRAKPKSGRPWEVGGLEDHLLILLVYDRCYVTQAFIGFFYGVDRSVICRAIKRVEGPVRPLFAVRRDPKASRREAEALIIDCTEQPIERPRDNATQQAHYSGKKKRHTLKTEYVVSAAGRIVSVSASHPGSRHDLTIRRAGPPLPRRARGYADGAYQGYGRDHPNLDVPTRSQRGRVDAGGERLQPRPGRSCPRFRLRSRWNGSGGSFRVAVEHRIGRAKRFRIVSERFRNPRETHHAKTSIVAGLVNLEAGFAPC